MLARHLATFSKISSYGFASKKIKVKNPVAELDGD